MAKVIIDSAEVDIEFVQLTNTNGSRFTQVFSEVKDRKKIGASTKPSK